MGDHAGAMEALRGLFFIPFAFRDRDPGTG